MTCSVNRNKNGIITNVSTPKGEASLLFAEINSNAFIATPDDALSIVSAVYEKYPIQDNNQNTYATGEPKITYQGENGQYYQSIEDLIADGNEGAITAGTFSGATQNFEPVFKVDTNTEINKFITQQVQEGTLNGKKEVLEDGTVAYHTKGEFPESKYAMATLARMQSKRILGTGSAKATRNGTLILNREEETFIAEMPDGTLEAVKAKELPNYIGRALNSFELANILNTYTRPVSRKQQPKTIDESELKNTLLAFLASMGFSTTTLQNYQKRYNTVFGKDPDILALTDISNKVVAFAQGQETVVNMSEEVAHIAIEAYSDQNSILEALTEVANTKEYQEFSEYYRTKYAPFYKGLELEEQVRKEVLGKILAKAIAQKFEGENRTLTSILRGYWNRFTNFLKSNFKSFHASTIDRITNEIAESVLAREDSQFQNNIRSNANFFYSAMSGESQKISQDIYRAKALLEDMLKKTGKLGSEKYALEKIYDEFSELNILDSVNTIIGITDRQLKQVEAAIKQVEKTGEVLDQKTETIALSIGEHLKPLLSRINEEMSKLQGDNFKSKNSREFTEKLSEKIIDIRTRYDNTEPKLSAAKRERYQQIFKESIDSRNMSENQYEKTVRNAEQEGKDISWITKHFGIPSNSANHSIRLLHRLVSRMRHNVRTKFITETNKFIKIVEDNKYARFQESIIKKDAEGLTTHYFQGPRDEAAYHKKREDEITRLLSLKTGLDPKAVQQSLEEGATYADIIKDEQKLAEFGDELSLWSEQNQEKVMDENYYQELRKKYDFYEIGRETKEFIKSMSARRADIGRQYQKQDGSIDRTKMTESDRYAIDTIKKERAIFMSPVEDDGKKKPGLEIKDWTNMSADAKNKLQAALKYKVPEDYKGKLVVLSGEMTLEMLPHQSRIALDLNTLTYARLFSEEKTAKGELSEKFLSQLEEMEARVARGEMTVEEVRDFVFENGTISFSDEYYESLGDLKNYAYQVEQYIDTIPERDEKTRIQTLLGLYRAAATERALLTKQNKSARTNLEADVHNMPEETRRVIRDIDEQLLFFKREIKLPEQFEIEGSESVMEVTDEFFKMARERGKAGSDEKLTEFAKEHMTEERLKRVITFEAELDAQFRGARAKTSQEDFLQNLEDSGKLRPGMTREEVRAVAIKEYAFRNMASYFKKYTPKGFSESLSKLGTPELTFSEFFTRREESISKEKALSDLTINMDYSWLEESDNMNKKYKKQSYYLQPKELDLSWFEKYGISVQEYLDLKTDDITSLTATKNLDEWEYYKMIIKMREETLKLTDDTERVSKYLRPQISKSGFEVWTSTATIKDKGKTILDWGKDFFMDREDEKSYGETIGGTSMRGSGITLDIIPKYFDRKLRAPEAITENTNSATLLALKEAMLYSERLKIEKDMRSVLHQIKEKNYTTVGASKRNASATKPGEFSNAYQMGQELLSHNLYGVKQTRAFFVTTPSGKEVDLTKVMTNLQKFSVFTNLAYNVFVDLTGATTGFLNNIVDRFAGDYYHKTSVNRANKQVTALMPKYLDEIGKITRNSQLGMVLELLGTDNVSDRISESKYGRLARVAKESPFLFSKLSNMALAPKISYAILYDTRLSEGGFVSFENFLLRKRAVNPDKSIAEVEVEWKAIESKSLGDYLKFTEESVTFNENFEQEFGEDSQAVFDDIVFKTAMKAQQVIMNSDGVLNETDQVAAQRDVLTNTLVQHAGWMFINLTRRFKKDFYNSTTDNYEEGHYRTLLRLLSSLYGTIRGKGNIQDTWQALERYQKRNMRRIGVETAIMIALLVMGEAVLAGDDDDDTAAENLAQLIFFRTVSESNSSQLIGIPGSLIERASAPIPSFNQYKLLNPLTTVPKMWQEDEDGNNKFIKEILKNTPLKRIDQYSDLQQQIDSYRHFNTPTLITLGDRKEEEDVGGGKNSQAESFLLR
jgi:hypothetical protein